MSKRLLSGAAWFVVIPWVWNYAAWMLGVPEVLGPIMGAAIGLFVVVDPWRLIWTRPPEPNRTPALVGELRPLK